MAENDMIRRLLDAGAAFTQMTQQRAEAIVRDLMGAGEVQSEQMQATVQELVDRSRENTERLFDTVRSEMRNQIASLGLATTDDIESLRRELRESRQAPRRPPARKKKKATTQKKAATKRAPAKKKATAKKATAKKSPAKKTTAKKSTANKSTANKSTAKKTTAKRTTAKRTPAKKST